MTWVERSLQQSSWNKAYVAGAPRIAVFGAIADHTAHHRGALTVYARLNGVAPPMPYMDM